MPVSTMLVMNRLRLPNRADSLDETATPTSSEAKPKPLNQLKRFWSWAAYLKNGSMTLDRITIAMK